MPGILEAPALDVCLAIARFLDLADPSHPTHHLQTAYLSLRIADAIVLPREEAKELFIASLFHDFGLLDEEKEISYELSGHPSPSRHRHAILAYLLLQELQFLKDMAPNLPRIILYHHLQMREISREVESPLIRSICKSTKEEIPLSSFILHLTEEISRAIDISRPILHQRKEIIEKVKNLRGSILPSQVVDAFLALALEEALWLQLTSPMLCHFLRQRFPFPERRLNWEEIMAIAHLFCDVVDFKSASTSVHSLGVAVTGEAFAQFLNLPPEEVKLIKIAGYLHDLGKLAVPSKLLEKEEKLTEEEKDMIKAHAYYTYDILSNIRGFEKLSQLAGFHHERLDGSGYPFRLKGEEIPLGARILAVADVFSAMREHRPYRAVMSREDIIKIVREDGEKGKLDPDVVQELIEHYEELEARFLDTQFSAMQRYRNIWRRLTSISLGM